MKEGKMEEEQQQPHPSSLMQYNCETLFQRLSLLSTELHSICENNTTTLSSIVTTTISNECSVLAQTLPLQFEQTNSSILKNIALLKKLKLQEIELKQKLHQQTNNYNKVLSDWSARKNEHKNSNTESNNVSENAANLTPQIMRDDIINSLVQIIAQDTKLRELRIEHESQTMLLQLKKIQHSLQIYRPYFTPSQSDFSPLHRWFLALKKNTTKEVVPTNNHPINIRNSIAFDIIDSIITKVIEIKITPNNQIFSLEIKDRLCFNILYDEEKGVLSFSTRRNGFVVRIEVVKTTEKEYSITPKDFYFENAKWTNIHENEFLNLDPAKFIMDTLWFEIDTRKKEKQR